MYRMQLYYTISYRQIVNIIGIGNYLVLPAGHEKQINVIFVTLTFILFYFNNIIKYNDTFNVVKIKKN